MSAAVDDVIDRLVGIELASPLAAIRARRPVTRENIQASYEALFDPIDPGTVTLRERFAVAVFVARLHRQADVIGLCSAALAAAGSGALLADAIEAAARSAETTGPYGASSAGDGSPAYHVSAEHRATLGQRIAAAFEHAHLLVFHPRASRPDALRLLVGSGWSASSFVWLPVCKC